MKGHVIFFHKRTLFAKEGGVWTPGSPSQSVARCITNSSAKRAILMNTLVMINPYKS